MVCTLNPQIAEKRAKELDEKLQELHEELSKAHDAVVILFLVPSISVFLMVSFIDS